MPQNGYCAGIVNKLAYEEIGTGPRLEIEPDNPGSERASNDLESIWNEWADEAGFVERLIAASTEEIVGGEIFNMFRVNKGLTTVPVDFEQYEGIDPTPIDRLESCVMGLGPGTPNCRRDEDGP